MLQSLHELVSFIHGCVSWGQLEGNSAAAFSISGEEGEVEKIIMKVLFDLEEDPNAISLEKFYRLFDNLAMDAHLNGKEAFVCQAFNDVLVQF
ncbi:hypothetical protein Sango_0391300 [Sesamum angolense]|uniref:Uncharacterized protein n=1 Tax=Sesamum angolense TaxID=2727404 RepID=A0AAE1XAY3_9LAMI|nr:hypothetical protein Sango_0391300 [Sesamum angolense]